MRSAAGHLCARHRFFRQPCAVRLSCNNCAPRPSELASRMSCSCTEKRASDSGLLSNVASLVVRRVPVNTARQICWFRCSGRSGQRRRQWVWSGALNGVPSGKSLMPLSSVSVYIDVQRRRINIVVAESPEKGSAQAQVMHDVLQITPC